MALSTRADHRVVGGPDACPVFRTEWKHRDHRSAEFDGAPMPFAAFFAPGGHRVPRREPDLLVGGLCAAGPRGGRGVLDFLQVGDRVEIV